MQVFVFLASIRRSLFSDDDQRKIFLQKLLAGIETVLRTNIGLNNQDNYHEFCRLLAKLKANFQLNEFVSCANYASWLEGCASFSVKSFQQWSFSAPSVYYLLNFWSRMIASKPYLKSDTPSFLEKYVPELCNQFILSRMELAKGVAKDDTIDSTFFFILISSDLQFFRSTRK